MLVVETVAKIRRAYFVQHKPIKQICRELKLSPQGRQEGDPLGGNCLPLHPQRPACTPSSGPGATSSTGCWRLIREAGAGAADADRIFEALRGLGYEGGYDAVRRYAKKWKRQQASVTAPPSCRSSSPGRGLPVRLEPRDRADRRRHHGRSRSLTSGSATRACCSCGPIRARARRWSSTPTTGRSPSSAAPASGASTTT